MSRLLGHPPSPAMVVALLALFMVAGSPAQAARKDSGVVDASKRVAGFTASQLLREEWRQSSSFRPMPIRSPAQVTTIACRPVTRTRS